MPSAISQMGPQRKLWSRHEILYCNPDPGLCIAIYRNAEAGIVKKAAKLYVAVKASKAEKKIYVSAKKYPQSAKHIAHQA